MNGQRIVTGIVLLGALSLCASAQTEAPSPVDKPGGAVAGATQLLKRAEGQKGLDTLVSVNIREMDLTQAVRSLAEESGINIAIGKEVDGKVSCSLANVTARTVLEAFLRSNGYTYIERDGVLIVVKEAQVKDFDKGAVARKVVRKTFRIPYTGKEKEFVAGSTELAKADDSKPVAEIIREMLSARGKVAYYERQHILVVEDDEEIVALVEQFVNALWETPLQVFIDSRLIEVSLEDGEDYGLRWDVQNKVSGVGRRNHKTGVDDVLGTTFETVGPTLGLDRAFTYGIVNSNIEVVLEALSSRERVDLQSNPSILVVNHRTASIIVGQEVPYISSEESTGGNPIRTVEFKEVAVRLDVTPHVQESMVFLDVHTAVKSVIGYTEDPREPIISTREAVTNVVIHDGATLIIGGLVQRNATQALSETPLLARIPVLGWFFRQRGFADTKNDLIFLLTPRIVTPEIVELHKEKKSALLKPLPQHRSKTYWRDNGLLENTKDKPWWRR